MVKPGDPFMIPHMCGEFATSRRGAWLTCPAVVLLAPWGAALSSPLLASPLEFPAPPVVRPVESAVDAPAADPAGVADEDAATPPRRVPRLIVLVGVDTPGDPAASLDSPTESSGPFDALRGDLGEDDDLAAEARRKRRRQFDKPADVAALPDPLRGTPLVSPEKTGADADAMLRKMLPPRSDSWADWSSGTEPLHFCGEPRWLPPCVPPPPCHPSLPPQPYDLVGVRGTPTDGPIYRGPCQPRTGTHDDCPHPHLHRLHDRLFDVFYMWK
jgi:hypothetical protein